jgi:uncharacterized protein
MWYKIQNHQVKINILVKPNARKTDFLGIGEQGLLISLHAKPHKGEANRELISYLAKLFKLPKSQITLLKGEGSRYKQVVIPLTESVFKIITANISEL